MVLAKEEVIVNEWEYATSKMGKSVTSYTLTVTNKRIVSTLQNAREVRQREIPVSSVQNVSLLFEKPSQLPAILLITLGCLIGLAGIALFLVFSSLWWLIPIVPGVAIIIYGLTKINGGTFYLELSTNMSPEYELMALGDDKSYTGSKSSSEKIFINNDVAKEIIDSLGAIIIDNKEPQPQVKPAEIPAATTVKTN